jgi:methylated-DNA-[protein]-cysteine S-methyltransferase
MPASYLVIPSAFGDLGLVWGSIDGRTKVVRVMLPARRRGVVRRIREVFPEAVEASTPAIDRVADGITRFLGGEPVTFRLSTAAIELCPPFQQRVLEAEHGIPRGSVSTYGRIARHLGAPRAARAVGQGLARNPTPIIVPCHRAIRSDGGLGGYRGGARMKRALLELEGIEFTRAGKVQEGTRFHY